MVSHVHCVPKKGGITVVPNDKDELIPQRIVTGYRMVIDFRKLNKATRKIITLYLLLIKCYKDYPNIHISAFQMVILVSLKYLCQKMIRKRPLLLALSVPLLIDVCLLVYVMHLLPFKDA